MNKKTFFLCFFLCAALLTALPCLAQEVPAPADEASAEEVLRDAEFRGVYQFGQMPETSEDAREAQLFSLSPTDYADQLNSAIEAAMADPDAFSQPAAEGKWGPALEIKLWRDDVRLFKIPATANGDSPEFDAALQAVVNAHPEWYFLNSHYSFMRATDSSGTYITRFFLYTTGLYGTQLTEQRAQMEQAVTDLAASLPGTATQAQTALLLHDYFASTVQYDSAAPNRFNLYGALIERRAVCQGIALAYEYLLEQCGIQSRIVSSQRMNHAWNAVEVDSVWYQADATWAQPSYAGTNSLGTVSHQYLLLSRDEMCGRHNDDPATTDQTCTDIGWTDASLADSWWADLRLPVQYTADGTLFFSRSGDAQAGSRSQLYRCDLSGENPVLLADLGSWYLPPAGNRYDPNASAGLVLYGDYLYAAGYNWVLAYRLTDLLAAEDATATPACLYPGLVTNPDELRLTGLTAPRPGSTDGGIGWFARRSFSHLAEEQGTLTPPDTQAEPAAQADFLACAERLAGLGTDPLLADYNCDGTISVPDLVTLFGWSDRGMVLARG